MTNREKVIKGLECCRWGRQNVKPEKFKCDECPYKDETIMNAFSVFQSCTNVLAREALDLLKKQQKLIDEITQRRANDGAFD